MKQATLPDVSSVLDTLDALENARLRFEEIARGARGEECTLEAQVAAKEWLRLFEAYQRLKRYTAP